MSEFVSLTNSKVVHTSSTSKGDQPKFYIDNKWYKVDKFGYEGLAEEVASSLLEMSSLPRSKYVLYNTCKIEHNGIKYNGCVSTSFTKDFEEVVTFEKLFKFNRVDESFLFKTPKEAVKQLIDVIWDLTKVDVTSYLKNIFTLDTVILNEDRHLNNMALILNRKSGTFKECPIFDNGLSLLSDTTEKDGYPLNVPLTTNMNKVKPRSFGRSFDDLLDIFGPSFTIHRGLVEKYMTENREKLGRIYNLLDWQLDFYPQIFIENTCVTHF